MHNSQSKEGLPEDFKKVLEKVSKVIDDVRTGKYETRVVRKFPGFDIFTVEVYRNGKKI